MSIEQLKSNPIAFMESNIIKVTYNNSNAGLVRLKLQKATVPGKIIDSKGKKIGDCNIYELKEGDSGKDSINAYWCPYDNNSVHSVTVHNKADFMFTPRMNGCSFGVSSPSKDGAVRVAHANTQDNKELDQIEKAMQKLDYTKGIPPEMNRLRFLQQVAQQKAQKGQLSTELDGDLAQYLSTSMYQNLELTTFGVRNSSNKWSFYFQGRVGETLYGCFPFQAS